MINIYQRMKYPKHYLLNNIPKYISYPDLWGKAVELLKNDLLSYAEVTSFYYNLEKKRNETWITTSPKFWRQVLNMSNGLSIRTRSFYDKLISSLEQIGKVSPKQYAELQRLKNGNFKRPMKEHNLPKEIKVPERKLSFLRETSIGLLDVWIRRYLRTHLKFNRVLKDHYFFNLANTKNRFGYFGINRKGKIKTYVTGTIIETEADFKKYLKQIKKSINENQRNQEDKVIIPEELPSKLVDYLGVEYARLLGSGMFGSAYDIGDNTVMKITTDVSEATNAYRVLGKRNKHLADVYNVYKLEEQYDSFFVIVMERLITKKSFRNLYEKAHRDFNSLEEYGYLDEVLFETLTSNSKDLQKVLQKEVLQKNTIWYIRQMLAIISELKTNGIQSAEFCNWENLGYKPTGELGYFDMGLTTDKCDSFERIRF